MSKILIFKSGEPIEPIVITKPTLFVDIDGTCTPFRRENEEYFLNGQHRFFHYEDLFIPGYFKSLPAEKNVVETIKAMIAMGYDVIMESSYLSDSKTAADEKISWAHEKISPDVTICLVPCGTKKEDYIKLEGPDAVAALLDDYSTNLHSWDKKGKGFVGIKAFNGINGTHGTWKGKGISTEMTPEEMFNTIADIMTDELINVRENNIDER